MRSVKHCNNNNLVFKTLDIVFKVSTDTGTMIHNDCGFQYISHGFKRRLDEAKN